MNNKTQGELIYQILEREKREMSQQELRRLTGITRDRFGDKISPYIKLGLVICRKQSIRKVYQRTETEMDESERIEAISQYLAKERNKRRWASQKDKLSPRKIRRHKAKPCKVKERRMTKGELICQKLDQEQREISQKELMKLFDMSGNSFSETIRSQTERGFILSRQQKNKMFFRVPGVEEDETAMNRRNLIAFTEYLIGSNYSLNDVDFLAHFITETIQTNLRIRAPPQPPTQPTQRQRHRNPPEECPRDGKLRYCPGCHYFYRLKYMGEQKRICHFNETEGEEYESSSA